MAKRHSTRINCREYALYTSILALITIGLIVVTIITYIRVDVILGTMALGNTVIAAIFAVEFFRRTKQRWQRHRQHSRE